jgi:hypothetical protein
MNRIKDRLTRLESHLQSLIEGNLARLLPIKGAPQDLALRLSKALGEGVIYDEEGQGLAPDLFILLVHPGFVPHLEGNRTWSIQMARTLQEVGTQAGLCFVNDPVLRVVPASDLAPGEIQVLARNSLEDLSHTDVHEVSKSEKETSVPGNAFLIVNGTQVYALSERVVNIGRSGDNHLVIDDPEVSRRHAQLRVIKDRFVIFDLDSAGGTRVNGERVEQRVLKPGDVISLSDIPLVFGQDILDPGDTQEYHPTS